MTTTTVAFLGLGAMGRRMAAHLPEASRVVWTRSRATREALARRGWRVADTPRQAAAGADIVMSMVTDDEAARFVWLDPSDGAVKGLSSGAVAVESSTVTPGWVAALAAAVEGRGATLVDAPVAGSTPQAEAGQLAFLMGGSPEAVARVERVVEPMAKVCLHAGPTGRGALLKLLVNASFAAQVAVLAELLEAAEQQGWRRDEAAELLGALPVTSPAARTAGAMIAAGDHRKRFPIDLVAKDLRYAAALGSDLTVVEAVAAAYRAASEGGRGDLHLTAVRPV